MFAKMQADQEIMKWFLRKKKEKRKLQFPQVFFEMRNFFSKKTSSYRHYVSALPEPPPGGGRRGAREADLGVASHSHEHPEAVLEDAAEVAHKALLPLCRWKKKNLQ